MRDAELLGNISGALSLAEEGASKLEIFMRENRGVETSNNACFV